MFIFYLKVKRKWSDSDVIFEINLQLSQLLKNMLTIEDPIYSNILNPLKNEISETISIEFEMTVKC